MLIAKRAKHALQAADLFFEQMLEKQIAWRACYALLAISEFKVLAKMQSGAMSLSNMLETTCKKVVERLMYDAVRDEDTPALRYGRDHEDLVIRAYEVKFPCSVQRPVGLIVQCAPSLTAVFSLPLPTA